MKIVALDHEKCRYYPLNLGNQERKESYLKKEQYEEERSSSEFYFVLKTSRILHKRPPLMRSGSAYCG